jgi:hypothetical protein
MAAQNTLQNIDYQSRGSNVDWAKLTSKLGAEVSQIGKDREKAREEIETQYSDALTKLNKPLNLEKQTLTNFVIDGADKYKKMALDLKKKLYKQRDFNWLTIRRRFQTHRSTGVILLTKQRQLMKDLNFTKTDLLQMLRE